MPEPIVPQLRIFAPVEGDGADAGRAGVERLFQGRPAVDATVRPGGAPDRFLLHLGGTVVEIRSGTPFADGETVRVRLAGSAPNLVLELARVAGGPAVDAQALNVVLARGAMDLLAELGLPGDAEHLAALKAVARFGAVTGDAVRAARRGAAGAARDARPSAADASARLDAAAFLAARRLPVDPGLVRGLASLAADPAALGESLDALARAAQAVPAEDPESPLGALARAAAVTAAGPPVIRPEPADAGALREAIAVPPAAALRGGDVAAEVAQALATDPAARAIDEILHLLDTLPIPARGGRADPAAVAEVLGRLRGIVASAPAGRPAPGSVAALARPLLEGLPAAAREEIRAALGADERNALAQSPALRWLRGILARAEDLADRTAAVRLLNQAALARQDDVRFAEVPLLVDGMLRSMPVRLIRRRGGRGTGGGGGDAAVQIDVEMSALGPVRAQVSLSGRRAGVRFRVRDASVQSLFRDHLGELAADLEKAGFQPQAEVAVAPARAPADTPLDALALPGEAGLDVKA